MRIYKIIQDTKGLTLIELMIVLVLSLLLMAAVYMTYQTQHATSTIQHEVSAVQQDLSAVLDIMAKDIRNAGCDPTLQTTAGIMPDETGPTSLSITMDLNEDGDTSDTNPDEQVIFTFNGSGILRNGGGVVRELVQNVTTFGLTYYDEDNVVIPPTGGGGAFLTSGEAEDVVFVEIQVQLRSDKRDPETNQFISRTMTKRVKMRNQGI